MEDQSEKHYQIPNSISVINPTNSESLLNESITELVTTIDENTKLISAISPILSKVAPLKAKEKLDAMAEPAEQPNGLVYKINRLRNQLGKNNKELDYLLIEMRRIIG